MVGAAVGVEPLGVLVVALDERRPGRMMVHFFTAVQFGDGINTWTCV